MGKLPNDNIGKIAVSKVYEALSFCECLSPNIPTDDTIMSWDGEIFVFNSGKRTKNNLYSTIPIQVKGHEVDYFRKTQQFNKDDLNNYLLKKSIIFFSVKFNPEKECRIYYKALHEIDIKQILSTFDGKQERTLTMNVLPDNAREIEKFILKFAKEHNEYQSMKEVSSVQELFSKTGKNVPLSFSLELPVNPSLLDLVNAIKKEQPYLIYQPAEGIKIPVDRIKAENILIKTKRKAIVSVQGKTFFDEVAITTDGNTTKYTCSDSLYFEINNSTIIWSYNIFLGNYDERKTVCNFLYEMCVNKVVSINNISCSFSGGNEAFDFNKIKRFKNFYDHFDELLTALHVEKKPSFDHVSDKDFITIENLYKTVVLHEKFSKFSDNDSFHFFHAFGIKFLVFVRNYTDYCLIENWDESGYSGNILRNNDDEPICSDIFFILACSDSNGFELFDNINYEKLYEVIAKGTKNKQDLSLSVYVLLNLLKAYDNTNREYFLKHSEEISNLISANVPEFFSLINAMQIKKRKGDFSQEDVSKLHECLNHETENINKLAIYTLLEDRNNCKEIFDSLTSKEKAAFQTWPIYNLLLPLL